MGEFGSRNDCYCHGRRKLLNKALYGSDGSGDVGFIKQLMSSFPDGYFTEGAYYQRYAIWPL